MYVYCAGLGIFTVIFAGYAQPQKYSQILPCGDVFCEYYHVVSVLPGKKNT